MGFHRALDRGGGRRRCPQLFPSGESPLSLLSTPQPPPFYEDIAVTRLRSLPCTTPRPLHAPPETQGLCSITQLSRGARQEWAHLFSGGWHPEWTDRCEACGPSLDWGGSKTGSSSRPRGARHLLEPSGGDRWGARCPGQEEEQSPFPFRPSRSPAPHCGMQWSWPALLGPLCTASVFVSSSALCLLPAWLRSSFLCWSCRAVLGSRA